MGNPPCEDPDSFHPLDMFKLGLESLPFLFRPLSSCYVTVKIEDCRASFPLYFEPARLNPPQLSLRVDNPDAVPEKGILIPKPFCMIFKGKLPVGGMDKIKRVRRCHYLFRGKSQEITHRLVGKHNLPVLGHKHAFYGVFNHLPVLLPAFLKRLFRPFPLRDIMGHYSSLYRPPILVK